MSLATLTNAATLKGYLLATDAPKSMVSLAEQIVDAATQALTNVTQPAQRVRNEDVGIPELSGDLAEAIKRDSKAAPSHDEYRFAAPETDQSEVNLDIPADDVADEPENVPVSTGGGRECKPAEAWETFKVGGQHAPSH